LGRREQEANIIASDATDLCNRFNYRKRQVAAGRGGEAGGTNWREIVKKWRKAVFSSKKKKHCAEKRFPVTSNLRYMHGVLNIDEIKN
jgi:hypothetical protein